MQISHKIQLAHIFALICGLTIFPAVFGNHHPAFVAIASVSGGLAAVLLILEHNDNLAARLWFAEKLKRDEAKKQQD